MLPRAISILGANPGSAFSATVATNPVVGAFPSDPELLAAALEADGTLITQGYFQSINSTLGQPFMAFTSPLGRSADIPMHYGNTGRVEVTKTLSNFTDGSVTVGSDIITISGHGLATGDTISFSTTGVLPSPFVAGTAYYAVVISSSVFKVSSTLANALASVVIDITSAAGGGVHTVMCWITGQQAESLDDILNAIAGGETYVETGAFTFLYKEQDGNLHHVAQYARIELPQYSRTSVLQANKADETLIVAIMIKILTKNASPAPFPEWTKMADAGLEAIIRDGSYQPGGDE